MCRRKRIDGQKSERRWAVDEDVVIVVCHLAQGIAQAYLPPLHLHQLHFGTREFHIRGQDIYAVVRRDNRLPKTAPLNQNTIGRGHEHCFINAKAARGIPLRVDVNEPHTALGTRNGGGEVHRRCRLADAALLAGNRYDICHGIILSSGV